MDRLRPDSPGIFRKTEQSPEPMNGLDLEPFLKFVQTDIAVWLLLVLALLVMVIAIWAGAGSHKALRKCLILSIVAHILLVRYGEPVEWTRSGLGVLSTSLEQATAEAPPVPPGIRSLEILDLQNINDPTGPANGQAGGKTGQGGGRSARGILPGEISETLPEINPNTIRPDRPDAPIAEIALNDRTKFNTPDLPTAPILEKLPTTAPMPEFRPTAPIAAPAMSDSVKQDPARLTETERNQSGGDTLTKPATPRPPVAPLPTPEPGRRTVRTEQPNAAAAAKPAQAAMPRPEVKLPSIDVAANLVPKRPSAEVRTFPAPLGPDLARQPAQAKPAEELAPPVPVLEPGTNPRGDKEAPARQATALAKNSNLNTLPESDLRSRIRTKNQAAEPPALAAREKAEIALPKPDLSQLGGPSLLSGNRTRPASRSLEDIPLVYRSRLDPNRAKLALKAGASGESEKSVEMALEWLRKHQDADGRWDGGMAKYRDGTIAPNEDSFTLHCPPGDICFGECYYWEADTALTGLSLLAYLGAGYTHTDGKYADTVARGLDFLIRTQKPDGDLRGRSVAVGMYCHAMASLAICEAFALTGDERLKKPAANAIQFLVDAQAEGGAAWRYEPKAPVGDTSILGWVVLALRSGRSMGFNVPEKSIQGIQAWLDGVQSGKSGGLSKYQPWKEVTPTMTAEAWVCRLFLNLDANTRRNREAADYLLEHGPDRDPYNLYYWYYGTLSMYQNGGQDWEKWNGLVRDRIVRRQKTKGHQAGSWDPDDSSWGTYGGRIYCTALATLSLEVYYRFLRLYDEPATAAK